MTTRSNNGELMELWLDDLKVSPYQIRKVSGTEELDQSIAELAESINEVGLIQPVTVRRIGDSQEYEIVAGHRRVAACRVAGLETAMCRIVDITDKQAEEMLVMENYSRLDVTPIEEGMHVKHLLMTRSREEVAKLFGRSVDWVIRRAGLSNLCDEARIIGTSCKWQVNWCEELARYPQETQKAMLEKQADMLHTKLEKMLADAEEGNLEDSLWSEDVEDAMRLVLRNDPTKSPWVKYYDQCKNCECGRTDKHLSLFNEEEEEARCLKPDCWEKCLKYWLKNASKIIRNMYGLELMEDGDRWGGYRGSDNHDELNTEPFIMTHPEGMQLGCIKWRVSKKEDEEEDEEEVKAEIMPLPSEENVDIWVKCMAMSDYFGGLPLDKMTPELTLLLAACLGVNELEVYEQIGGDDDEYSRAGMFEMAEEHADISQGRITCVYTDLARILHPSMLEYVGDLSKSWYNVIIKSEMCNRLSNNWQDERYLGLIDKYQKAADDKIAQIKALNKRIKE